jgi:P4 family phage/plasmid primase-like protien
MKFSDYCENNNKRFIFINYEMTDIKDEDGLPKKRMTNMEHYYEWTKKPLEELEIIKRRVPKTNIILYNCDCNEIIIDTDCETDYNIVKKFLIKKNIYDENCITPSFRGKTLNLKYKRHFWLKPDNKNDFKGLPLNQIKPSKKTEIFFGNRSNIAEFADNNIDFDNIPKISIDEYHVLCGLLSGFKNNVDKIEIDFSDDEEEEKQEKQENKIKQINKNNENNNILNNSCISDDDLIKLLNGLKKDKYDDFDKWLIIYFIFTNNNFNLKIFDEFSKKSKKYNYVENMKIIKNITPRKGYTINTLYFWLKEDNPELFNELQKSRTDLWIIVNNETKSDYAKLYFSMYPTKYIRSDKTGWYEYNENNILVPRCNSPPSSLLNNIIDTMQKITEDLKNLLSFQDEKYKEKMMKLKKAYKDLGNPTYVDGIIKVLIHLYTLENLDDLIDNNNHLLAFNNCLYDIQNKKFRKISPTDYITKTTKYNLNNYNIDDEIKKQIYNLLFSIFENDEMVEYYLIFNSLSLFTTNLQSLYIHQGEGGNGKGLLSSLFRYCLGDYFITAENTFLTTKYEAGKSNPTLANAKGGRYFFISEPDNGKENIFNIDLIKTLTGGDPVTCKDLYKSNITYLPQFIPNIQCNQKPKLEKLDNGIKRRFKIIKYKLNFVDNPTDENERKRDYSLLESIKNKEFIRNFILILINKASLFYGKDYDKVIKVPQEVMEETSEYLNENNPIIEYIEDNLIITKNKEDRILKSELYIHYTHNQINPLSAQKFGALMTFNKIQQHKAGKWYFIGIKYINNEI